MSGTTGMEAGAFEWLRGETTYAYDGIIGLLTLKLSNPVTGGLRHRIGF